MNCPGCGAAIDNDSRFCKSCGRSLSAEATPAPAPAISRTVSAPPVDVHRDPLQEKPVWEGRPAWRSYYGSWALWLLGSIVIAYLVFKYGKAEDQWRWPVLAVIPAAAVVLLIREALIILGIRYRLTTQRLFVDRGILRRQTDQTELIRIDDVRIRQGIMDRVVNTGDVEVQSSDSTDPALILESVSNPAEVAEALRLNMRAVRSKQTMFVESV